MSDDEKLMSDALAALTCSGEDDDPGHRCTHCDDYVDRNGPLRAALRERLAQPAQHQQDFSDAYQGAREDLAIWKKRALEAEALNRKFIANINGPTFMGEPAKPEQEPEPVGEMRLSEIIDGMVVPVVTTELPVGTKLYTAPPKRQPLTDEEIAEFAERMEASNPTDSFWREFARAIEAAHGIKGEA